MSHYWFVSFDFIPTNLFQLAYKGLLKCGNDYVRHQKLEITLPKNLDTIGPAVDRPWIEQALNPNQPVVFIDTDAKGWLESDGIRKGAGGPINEFEASIVQKLVHSLSVCGLENSSVGVITPFRSQVCFVPWLFCELLLLIFGHSHCCMAILFPPSSACWTKTSPFKSPKAMD